MSKRIVINDVLSLSDESSENGSAEDEAEGEAEGGENESIGSNDAGPSTAKVR